MKETLSRYTVQVKHSVTPNRRYRNKQHKLCKTPAYAKGLLKDEIIDYLSERQFTVRDKKKAAQYERLVKALETCGMNFVHMEAAAQEIKLTRIHCNREFCPTCGQNDSALHRKRAGRAQDRLLWAPLLGYMIFTVPRSISDSNPPRKTLAKMSKKAWAITKKYFDTPGGVTRTHFMGDDPGKLHIHFNVLFPLLSDRGTVSKECLSDIRKEWTDFINKEFNLNCDNTNIYYKFAIEDGRQIHKVKYVFRPVVTPDKFVTLSDRDKEYVLSFNKWHNTRWSGKLANNCWKKYFEEQGIELPKNFENVAPISGEKYLFMGIVRKGNVSGTYFKDKEDKVHQVIAVDNDTYLDLRTYLYLKKVSPGGHLPFPPRPPIGSDEQNDIVRGV